MDLQDKLSWCEFGLQEEKAFLTKYGKELGLEFNPEKKEDKKVVDLYHHYNRY